MIDSQCRLSGCASIEWAAPKRFPVLDFSSRAQNACAFGSKRRTFQTYRELPLLVKPRLRFRERGVDALGAAPPALHPARRTALALRVSCPSAIPERQALTQNRPRAVRTRKIFLRSFRTLRSSLAPLRDPAPNVSSVAEPISPARPNRARWKGILFRCLNRQKDSILPNLPDCLKGGLRRRCRGTA